MFEALLGRPDCPDGLTNQAPTETCAKVTGVDIAVPPNFHSSPRKNFGLLGLTVTFWVIVCKTAISTYKEEWKLSPALFLTPVERLTPKLTRPFLPPFVCG